MKTNGAVVLGLVTMIAGSLWAEEELQEAPAVILDSVKASCRTYAEEDEVKAEDLDAYLLKCINEELSDLEYRAIAKV